MSTIIDFRNGRYQGQVRNKLPDGVGIFFSIDLTFIIAHWREGKIFGKTIIIYSTGAIFCGDISDDRPKGICYYELQKQNIKVFFNASSSQKCAVIIPNFQTILELDRVDLKLIGKHGYIRNEKGLNKVKIQQIVEQKFQLSDERQLQNVFRYFQINFSLLYDDLFEELQINDVQYWMGFKNEGLGIKIKPLELHQHNGRTYRICQMGVMTKDNVLYGIGVKTNNGMFNKIRVEEGIFEMTNTLVSYQYDDQNIQGVSNKSKSDQNSKEDLKKQVRPPKCLTTFINYLKRSMNYENNYLFLALPVEFKKQIDKISLITFTQMKIEKAHQIIETPLNDSKVMEQIQKKRRIKILENSTYSQKKKYETQEYTKHNTNQMHLTSSTLNLMQLKEVLQRSVSKKKTSKNKIQIQQNNKVSTINKPKIPKDRSTSNRKNGSITPTKKSISKISQQKKMGVVKKQNLSYFSPQKNEKNKEKPIRQIESEKPVQIIKKYPSPILKKVKIQSQSPPKMKPIFKQRQLQDWQRNLKQERSIKIQKTSNSPLRKYGDLYKQKASSPAKKINRRILTQNIFQ